MPSDPYLRDVIANLILLIAALGGVAGLVWALTRKRRERARERKFLETRIRL